MPDDASSPMTFHVPATLKERLQKIATAEHRSLTKQMIAMLEEGADQRDNRAVRQPHGNPGGGSE